MEVFHTGSSFKPPYKVLDTLSLTLFHEYDKGIQSEVEVDDQLWTPNVASVICLLQNKVMFLLKITLMLS